MNAYVVILKPVCTPPNSQGMLFEIKWMFNSWT